MNLGQKIGEGWFITFADPREFDFVKKSLEVLGYEVGPGGLKKFAIDMINESMDEEKKIPEMSGKDRMKKILHENPDLIFAGLSLMGNLIGKKKK